ncbi:hypothetical protein [Natrinema salsiterrestre]|uniref:Uncharacterized protein n=1 Tax=Natrinema salsiterrestre TaxID=2950540 RepID=A0A9Q4Q1A1_9EURY|nr:hypothetical protein [Natrinema salsiterrestre]MDF9746999.1 hypothetical protein [Natrinema salsiterrestre]
MSGVLTWGFSGRTRPQYILLSGIAALTAFLLMEAPFNAVGAVIVAIWGTDSVGKLVGFFRRRLRSGSEN